MQKRLLSQILVLLLVAPVVLFGQGYFQQGVDYQIDLRLDDKAHELHGEWNLTYTNHSPDTLPFIYIHLWPNAYSSKSTALARQLLRQGNTDFYYSEEYNLGGIDSLVFTEDDKVLTVEATSYGPDVIKLLLTEPLLPQQETVLHTPFRLRIPPTLSRLGRVEQAYQLTQWYPKPAVYDRMGWNPMPYLDNGEFYSEFGQFKVSITLPANYVVAATGVLETPEERDWLLRKAAQPFPNDSRELSGLSVDSFPPSASATKTITYTAKDVHDFAWFADKRLYVSHDTLQLSGRQKAIDVWAFFTREESNLWAKAISYMKRATRFYSEQVGTYPYPQVSAIQCPGSAGGGMEYPMITLISREYTPRSLDNVLTHEIGHNWFYGILGSNERDHAWMDEGFNSYYDHLYGETYYPDTSKKVRFNLEHVGYRYFNITGRAQPPATTSEEMREYNYWIGAYTTPALALKQLAEYIGPERFRNAMRAYYEEWKFAHPQPTDVQRSLEESTGEDLSWLFQGFIESIEQQDYQIVAVKKQKNKTYVTIRNNGEVAGPFSLQFRSTNQAGKQLWEPGFNGTQTLELSGTTYDQIIIDPDQLTLDINRQNNTWQQRILPRLERLRLFDFNETGNSTSLASFPLLLYNEHDGLYAGIALSNRTILPRSFEWLIAPAYAFGSKSLVGFTGAQKRWWPRKGRIQEIALQASFRSFHFRTFEAEDLPLRYQRFSPGLRISLQPSRKRQWEQQFQWRSIFLQLDELNFDSEGNLLPLGQEDQWIHELSYTFQRKHALAPFRGGLYLEQSNYVDPFGRDQDFLKARFELSGRFAYEKDRALHWRIFAGRFLSNSLSNSSFTPANAFSLFDRGEDDYRFDNLYVDRSAGEDWGRQQLAARAGGFRAPLPANFGLGRSNTSVISANLSLDLPFMPTWLPLRPYVDAGSYRIPSANQVENEFLWVGGAALEWFDGQIGIYAPLFGADAIMNRLIEQGGIHERIAIRLQLGNLMPWKWIDRQEVF